jgi:hypothetical protein
MKAYEYLIIHHQPKTKSQEAKSTIIKPVTLLLAKDEKEVSIIAARAIPEKYMAKLSEVEIAVRPF